MAPYLTLGPVTSGEQEGTTTGRTVGGPLGLKNTGPR